jgi:nucleotidyltransferase substrate binding protein (TIGR01987 family)
MSERWILNDLKSAVGQLEAALEVMPASDLIRAGCIQYFEFCFELAWKAIKLMSSGQGLPDCASPKVCLKQAFTQGWLDAEDPWLAMLDARNRMAHTYSAKDALTIYDPLRNFITPWKQLSARLDTLD